MKFINDHIVVNADMSSSFQSMPILLDQIYGYSMQANFSGTCSGVFKLQCSNEDVKNPSDIVNWSDIPSSSQLVTEGGQIMWNVTDAFYKYVRVVYVRTTGTGVCDVRYFAKGV